MKQLQLMMDAEWRGGDPAPTPEPQSEKGLSGRDDYYYRDTNYVQ